MSTSRNQPPPLPGDVLRRLLRVARLDGAVLVGLAGGFALLSSASGDFPGAAVGFAAAACGAGELWGHRRLTQADPAGVKWLVWSQIALLLTILAYVVYQFFRYDPVPLLTRAQDLLSDATRANGLGPFDLAEQFGVTRAEFFQNARVCTKAAYVAIGVLSVLFQGGMALYYHRNGRISIRALQKT